MFISHTGITFITLQQGTLLHICTQRARPVGPSLNWTLLITMTLGIITGKLLKDFHWEDIHVTSIYMSLVKANHIAMSNIRRVGNSNTTHAQRRRIRNISEKHRGLPRHPLFEFCF